MVLCMCDTWYVCCVVCGISVCGYAHGGLWFVCMGVCMVSVCVVCGVCGVYMVSVCIVCGVCV